MAKKLFVKKYTNKEELIYDAKSKNKPFIGTYDKELVIVQGENLNKDNFLQLTSDKDFTVESTKYCKSYVADYNIVYKRGCDSAFTEWDKITPISVSANDYILLAGNNPKGFDLTTDDWSYQSYFQFNFAGDGVVKMLGPISSLINGGSGELESMSDVTFEYLFQGVSAKLDVSELKFPSVTSESCYYRLFQDDTIVKLMDKIEVDYVKETAFSGMFYGIKTDGEELTSPQIIVNGNIEINGLSEMFSNSEITHFGGIKANIIYNYALRSMFSYCQKLKDAEGKIAIKDNKGYFSLGYMFEDCINLESVSTDLLSGIENLSESYIFYGTFMDCKKLKNMPELPWKTLKAATFIYMFSGCEELTGECVLPAETVNTSYAYMFTGCSKITKLVIKSSVTLSINNYNIANGITVSLSKLTEGKYTDSVLKRTGLAYCTIIYE